MPKVSVILSSYNHAKFICESIENTLNQTFTDFELIIWDDGSSDDSWELINQYSDPRIKAFRNEVNIGGVFGVNKAIFEIALGEYIAIHHSDDVWELDKLQKQVDFLAASPNIGAVFTNTQPIDERGAPLSDQSHKYYKVFNQPNRSRYEWLRHFFFHGNALCHPSILIRKRCYEDCGLYLDSLAQLTDFDMWVRLCLKYDIHVLPERLVRFRVRDDEANASGNRPDVRIRDRSEFHYILKHFLHISTFEELVSIFPEAEKYYRPNGCEPRFVFAMIALGDTSLPWAKMLGIETLFDLFADLDTKKRIKSLYQFDYRDFTALTGKYDLFFQELLASQNRALAECAEVISRQAQQVAQLTRSAQTTSLAKTIRQAAQPTSQASIELSGNNSKSSTNELPADRSAYEKAAHLLELGQSKEGMAQLEALAEKGSSCWDVYNDLAVLYSNEGDYLGAVSYFQKGIALEGGSGTTARNFASVLLMTGDVEGALAVWGGILHEQPHDTAVLTVIRDILSNINPIPPGAWQKLVSDLRYDLRVDPDGLLEEALSHQHPTREEQGNHGAIEKTSCRTAGAPAKEIKIFQIYYDEPTRSKVDSAFIPLDNTENLRPDWCEYWPIRNVLLNHSFADDAYLGFFSPRFFEKTGMSGNEVLEKIRCNDDEVISFSPYFDHGAIYANPFIQGEIHHPGLIETMQNVLTLLNVDLNLNLLICDQTTTIFSNYFVARYSFWKKWFAYAEKIFEVCEGPACDLKASLINATPYRKGAEYAMKVFVLERLVTIVMEEQGIRSRIGIDIGKVALFLPRSKDNLSGLLVFDALKGQYRKTGLSVYKDEFFAITGAAGF